MRVGAVGKGQAGAGMAVLCAVLMIAQQVGGKATRDTLFLSAFGAQQLPKAIVAGAVLSLLGALLMSKALARFGPGRVAPTVFGLNAVAFGSEWLLSRIFPQVVAAAAYLHIALFGPLIVSAFWSVISERFDPHSAKHVVARVAAGATFGGVLGGLLVAVVGHGLDPHSLLGVLALLNAAGGLGTLRLQGREIEPGPSAADQTLSALRLLRENPYLRRLAMLVLAIAILGTFLDYGLKAQADDTLNDSELLSFFAAFYTATSLGTFALQAGVSRRALAKFGLGGTMAVLPVVVILTGTVGALATRLWTVALAQGSAQTLYNSLFRSGYELLYTPLPKSVRRPVKPVIDVGFDRMGDILGGGCVLLMLWLVDDVPVAVLMGLAALGALCVLLLSGRLHRGYVDQLGASLRTGALRLSEQEIIDATTRRTLSETTMAVDRETLLEEIRALRANQRSGASSEAGTQSASGGAEQEAQPGSPPSGWDGPQGETLTSQTGELLSGDEIRTAAALRARPFDARLVTWALPLVVQEGPLAKLAAGAVESVVDRVVGQLGDVLLDPEQPVEMRRRIPHLLRTSRAARTVHTLVQGLEDADFEVRYRTARSLARLCHGAHDLSAPEAEILAALERELGVGRFIWDRRVLSADDGEEATDVLSGALRERVNHSLEHAFTLLGLVRDRETVRLALRALASQDERLRGTALEYLDNVLPESIRQQLFPFIGDQRRVRARPQAQVIEELTRSADALEPDSDATSSGE